MRDCRVRRDHHDVAEIDELVVLECDPPTGGEQPLAGELEHQRPSAVRSDVEGPVGTSLGHAEFGVVDHADLHVSEGNAASRPDHTLDDANPGLVDGVVSHVDLYRFRAFVEELDSLARTLSDGRVEFGGNLLRIRGRPVAIAGTRGVELE